MFEFIVGLVTGSILGVGMCAWAVWSILDPKRLAENNRQHARK